MKWTRKEPGHYVAGPYSVQRLISRWQISGPGVTFQTHERKSDAQAECQRVAELRAADPDANAPTIGDIVEIIDDGRRGQVSTIIKSDDPYRHLWCLRLPYSKRTCRFRHEIKVVVP